MKPMLISLYSLLFFGCICLGCSDQQAPTSTSEESIATLNKASTVEWSFDYNFDWDPPYTGCATGAPMQNHGIVTLHFIETTTASGNWISRGYVDYKAYDGVTLENLSTGEIWTLQNGTNPWNEISKTNGVYQGHWHWNEVYTLDNQILQLHLKGFLTIDKNGNVTKDLQTYTCN